MAKKHLSGLNELMIVNPGFPTMERNPGLGQVFLCEDGIFYRLEGLYEDEPSGSPGEFYLGDDGTLYQVIHHNCLQARRRSY